MTTGPMEYGDAKRMQHAAMIAQQAAMQNVKEDLARFYSPRCTIARSDLLVIDDYDRSG